MYRRIRRPKDQEEYYLRLTDQSEFGIFSTFKDVFMAAGVIGFMEKRKREFSSSLEGMDWHRFNLETDETIINAVAISDSKNPKLVNTDEETFNEKVQIFEEYAAAGVEILYKKVMEDPKKAINLYIEYIMSMETETTTKERNLKDIADLLTF
ncbi:MULTISPECIES: DNA phosphorothioation-associated protein 4 [Cytobacillus]|uniref:DNA phosphorothioation-associated protein 4 n=1 Tax=Cytobacillus TaxID=2675230 RepID=UPI0020416C74|nr:DNA phosphorothioation-associated protein 4 [Cytobacillus oceanisediminis]MCM3243178.1 DNA phosphorothioation-associated protein 4 [Cytobacillus oceanisediminis]MDK7665421.1 DNA phosphorothioation-associated protein 4 [Cytobacillus oceanisediminis]